MAGTAKRRTVNVLKDYQTWEEYIKQLFDNVRMKPPNIDKADGPPILEGEVQAALKNAKDQKALSPDGVPAEILKLIEGKNLGWLTKVFNVIYDTGVLPTEWLKSEFVTLPKKPNAWKCSEFRTIMSHLLKTFLKIIQERYKTLQYATNPANHTRKQQPEGSQEKISKNEITKLKNSEGNITSNRSELLQIVEEFYRELYKGRADIHSDPKEITQKYGVQNQGSEEIPEIDGEEIQKALTQMKNNRLAGTDSITIEVKTKNFLTFA